MTESVPPSDRKPATAARRVPTPEQRRAFEELKAMAFNLGADFRFNRQEIYDERMDELDRRRSGGKPSV